MNNTNYNIAIIGQTGVGKSSLINYLYGEETVETGTGRPVTTNGFHMVKHTIEGMQVNIYDSWGLEVGKQDQWLKELDEELKKRGVDKPASEWFHSIFYCISAASARIQDADIAIIKKLRSEKNKVSIILTKSDAISEDDEKEFITAIKKELGFDLAIIPVCSEHKKTRAGETFQFGKEMVEKQSLIDLIDSLILRIPAHCKEAMLLELRYWRKCTIKSLNSKIDVFGFNVSDLQKEFSAKFQEIAIRIEKIGNDTENLALEQYGFIVDKLSYRLELDFDTKYLKLEEANFWSLETLKNILPILAKNNLNPLKELSIFSKNIFIKFKENSVKIHKDIDNFCSDIEEKICKRTQDLEKSLQGIKEELKLI